MASKIILTADDFGCIPFINNGIYKALETEKINSVACFVVFPDSENHIRELMAFKKTKKLDFGIGLHFSITAGTPLFNRQSNKSTSLTSNKKDPQGFFQFTEPEDLNTSFVKKDEFANELRAQISKLESILHDGGEEIDSVSNHHGVVYMADKLFNIYADEIALRKIPIRSPISWMRSGFTKKTILNGPVILEGIRLKFFKQLFATGKADFVRRRDYAKQKGILMPYCLNDMIYGYPDVENYNALLSNYTHFLMASEFMFHLGDDALVGVTDAEWKAMAPNGINPDYFANRQKELVELQKLDLAGWLSSGNVKKVKFRELDQWDCEDPKPLH